MINYWKFEIISLEQHNSDLTYLGQDISAEGGFASYLAPKSEEVMTIYI